MNFTKMHALGNDFIVIDCITQNLHLTPEAIKKLSDRHTGIGFDQLLLVEPPYSPDVDFHLRIYHSDGSELEQCANGARCFARFVKQKNLTKKRDIKVSTMKGVMELTLNRDETVTVNMGEPNFDPKLIPFVAQKEEKNYIIRTQHSTVLCGVVSVGHPHCVIQVDKMEQAEVTVLGPLLEQHERFPAKTNVGFMEIVDRSRIKLRVYEREMGETDSISGNSASSAVAVGIYQGQLDAKVKIELQGGTLLVEWQGKGKPLYITGPAAFIFDGFIAI